MKIKVTELVDEKLFISHLVLDCLNVEASKTITKKIKEESENDEHDICLTFNGVELDIRLFTKHLESEYERCVKSEAKNEALELFEKYKSDYNSKNCNNAKLSKLHNQMYKANQTVDNVLNELREMNIK